MDSALGEGGAIGAVEGDDDGDRAGPLAVGVLVVGVGVLDPVVAVGVDLRDTRHADRAQVAASVADGLCGHAVVPRAKDCVGNHDGGRGVDLVLC